MQPAYKLLPAKEYGIAQNMREGHEVPTWPINFFMNRAGMGDMVNYAAATVWMAKNVPWIQGRLFVNKFLNPLMQELHREFNNWFIYPAEDLVKIIENGTSIVGPDLNVNGKQITQNWWMTPVSAHPIDVAFANYVGIKTPPDVMLPVLDFKQGKYPELDKILPKRFAIIPTGFSAENRAVGGREMNPIIEHLLSRDITPVFVGKKDQTGFGTIETKFHDDIAFDKGLDLREKTTVMQLAYLCQHAEMTVGLDCGVLHLAALMKDSKIVFGYNVTTVEHRMPRRNHGFTIHVYLTKEDLACISCQSNMIHYPNHKFTSCIYKDNKCIEFLFSDESKMFRDAIDGIIDASAN
jgi:hypothetical protein